ncbi:MAG: GntR family transcriptional regulator [Microbacteriaceae bacterium]
MLFRLRPDAEVSLAEQIAVQVRAAVASGELEAGERLPPARDLARSLKINMHTVLRAYQQLRDEGIIEMRQGRGAFVCNDANAMLVRINELTTQLVDEAKKLGLSANEIHRSIDRMMGDPA